MLENAKKVMKFKIISKMTIYPLVISVACLLLGNVAKLIKIPFTKIYPLKGIGGLLITVGKFGLIAVGILVLIALLPKILKILKKFNIFKLFKGFKNPFKGLFGKDKSNNSGNTINNPTSTPAQPTIVINNNNNSNLKDIDSF